MPYDNRLGKVLAAVPCPACLAPIGVMCRTQHGVDMLDAHSARRAAWQRVRGPVVEAVQPPCACGHSPNRHSGAGGCDRCSCALSRAQVRESSGRIP